MNYGVKRLKAESGEPPAYELVGSDGLSLLLADQTTSPKEDVQRQMRLARPDGRLIATIDLPKVASTPDGDEKNADYAVIHDFAVYAILGMRQRPASDADDEERIYYTLEVEGEKWLALPHSDLPGCYALYDEVPAGLHTYETLTELDLPPSIGQICHDSNELAYQVYLSPERLQHTGLIVLAMAYLIDQSDGRR